MVEEDEILLSIVSGWLEYRKWYPLSEYKKHLNADNLSSKEEEDGWVFWSGSESEINEIIKHVFEEIGSYFDYLVDCLVQFWAPKEDGGQVYLSTSDQPFVVTDLCKGLCWYRKHCMDYGGYSTGIGPVGRVYQSRQPESSPDLRLYSTVEFPLRNYAARCGGKGYLALPALNLKNKHHCYGVMEFFSFDNLGDKMVCVLDSVKLQLMGLGSDHVNDVRVSCNSKLKQSAGVGEIKGMVELAMEVVPQLHLAVVWVPCKHCSDISPHNLSCMEITTYMTNTSQLYSYVAASRFHNVRMVNLRNKKSSFCRNICDFGISAENPMAHYAQLARLSVRYEIFLESWHNRNEHYVVEFFLQSSNDSKDGTFAYLLSKIMERKLKNIKLSSGGQLGDQELVVDPPYALRHESVTYTQERENQLSKQINMLEVIEDYGEVFSRLDYFTKYLEMTDLLCVVTWGFGWVFGRENSPQTDEINGNSSIEEKITLFMSKINIEHLYNLVQFWAPKSEEDRCLTTSDQPFAVGCPEKGLASFRKKSMEYLYCVDEGAKDEQVGPPGRVFRSGIPEFTPDLRLYSTTEFPLRDHAARCFLRKYCVLPVFHVHRKEECVGVLEFFFEYIDFDPILQALQAANLCVGFQASHTQNDISGRRKLALGEIDEALEVAMEIPQLHRAEVWATCTRCASENDVSCMERIQSTCEELDEDLQYTHIHTRKGISGTVLASANKSCFFRNSCHFSIVEHPLTLAHFMQNDRMGGCYAICLQSTHTMNLVYVLQFFLNQGPGKYGHILSLLNYLLPILKQNLKSFMIASGQQLGHELAIEVPVFPGEDELILSEINGHQDKFKFVPYSGREHQHSGHQQVHIVSDTNIIFEDEETSSSKMTKTGSRQLTFEDFKPHLGKKWEDAAKEMNVSESTAKRYWKDIGLGRWPNNENQRKRFHGSAEYVAYINSKNNMSSNHQNLPQASTKNTSQRLNKPHSTIQEIADRVGTVLTEINRQHDTFKFVPYSGREHKHSGPIVNDNVEDEVSSNKMTKTGSCQLTFEDFEPHLGKKWEDAAKEMNVSVRTTKRNWATFALGRWPNNEKQKNRFYKSAEYATYRNSKNNMSSNHQNLAQASTKSTSHLNLQPESDTVMIKAEDGDDTIKFQIRLSLGMDKLEEEVAKRLKLEMKSFKLKYIDSDDTKILLGCDEDLQDCAKDQIDSGKTFIKLLVQRK